MADAQRMAPAQRHECDAIVRAWLGAQPASMPIMVTVSTSLTKRWLLGLSAALYGVPLVLSSLGQNWTGLVGKLEATRRAVRRVHDASEGHHVIYADSTDAMWVNAPRPYDRPEENTVFISGECSMYPQCYRSLYATHARAHVDNCAHRRTGRKFTACYVRARGSIPAPAINPKAPCAYTDPGVCGSNLATAAEQRYVRRCQRHAAEVAIRSSD